MNDVEVLKEGELDYELGSEYKVKFGTSKYKAFLVYIGSKEECVNKESSIISCIQDKSLSGRATKKNSSKAVHEAESNKREECKLKLYESQIATLNENLKQKDTTIKQKESIIIQNEHQVCLTLLSY